MTDDAEASSVAEDASALPSELPERRPPPNVEDLSGKVGREIRRLRRAGGWTLEELSDRSGISTGLISQVERGLGNPSFSTMVQLAHALGVPVARLFVDFERRSPVVRRGERRRLGLDAAAAAAGVVNELLTPGLDHSLELIWVEAPPGYSSADTPFQHAGEEAGVILEGFHRVWLDGVPYDLDPGDAITYSSMIPHWYENRGDVTVKALWVITPPTL
jgi:transcriptional regulator with XRE-family HTH domain